MVDFLLMESLSLPAESFESSEVFAVVFVIFVWPDDFPLEVALLVPVLLPFPLLLLLSTGDLLLSGVVVVAEPAWPFFSPDGGVDPSFDVLLCREAPKGFQKNGNDSFFMIRSF